MEKKGVGCYEREVVMLCVFENVVTQVRKSTFSQPFQDKRMSEAVRVSYEKPSSPYWVMLYIWWGCRRDWKLITLGSERVNGLENVPFELGSERVNWMHSFLISRAARNPRTQALFMSGVGKRAWVRGWAARLTNLIHSCPGLNDAFAKRKQNTEVVDYGVPYDFASIMHYPFTAFSKNGKPTIRAIASMGGKTPYVELSVGDATQTNRMYKCNGE